MKDWMKVHGLTVLLAALIVLAMGTTVSAAWHWQQARSLRQRTEKLSTPAPDPTGDSGEAGLSTPGDSSSAPGNETTAAAQESKPAETSRRSHHRRGPMQNDDPAQDNDPAMLAAKRIDARHLFVPAPPMQFRNVIGVLGNQALYAGGQALSIGEQKDGATLKTVGPSWVEFEYEGQTVRIDVLQGGPGDSGPMMMLGRPGGGPMPPMDDAARQRMRESGGPGSLTPEQQQEMRRRFEELRNRRGGNGRRSQDQSQ